MTAPATQEVACPKCGGRTWDNREGKKNPKAPDFKCRDRSCDGVIWPPKNTTWAGKPSAQTIAANPQPSGKQPFSIGTLPIDEPPDPIRAELERGEGWAELRQKYGECLTFVIDNVVPVLNRSEIGTDPASVAAITATLYIERNKRGV